MKIKIKTILLAALVTVSAWGILCLDARAQGQTSDTEVSLNVAIDMVKEWLQALPSDEGIRNSLAQLTEMQKSPALKGTAKFAEQLGTVIDILSIANESISGIHNLLDGKKQDAGLNALGVVVTIAANYMPGIGTVYSFTKTQTEKMAALIDEGAEIVARQYNSGEITAASCNNFLKGLQAEATATGNPLAKARTSAFLVLNASVAELNALYVQLTNAASNDHILNPSSWFNDNGVAKIQAQIDEANERYKVALNNYRVASAAYRASLSATTSGGTSGGTSTTPTAAKPVITSVNPNPVTGSNSPQTVKIFGSNFLNPPTVTLTWTGQPGKTLSADKVMFISSSEVHLFINTTAAADTWSVKITNHNGQESNKMNFTVSAPPAQSQPPAKPVYISPAQTATNQPASSLTLKWNAAAGAAKYRVGYGTSIQNFNYTETTATSYTLTALSPGQVFYWQIEAINAAGRTPGDIFMFLTAAAAQTLGKAVNPSPTNGSTRGTGSVTASWANGGGATSYRFYWGANPSSLTSAGTVSGTSFTFPSLSAGTYYWRVDAVSVSGTVAGDVWSFTLTSASAADGSAPYLEIETPAGGAVIADDVVKVSGIASDAGYGSSGIRSVTVNGKRAGDDTASGSGVAYWHYGLAIKPGANTISVVATDGAGNAVTRTITVTSNPPESNAPAISYTSPEPLVCTNSGRLEVAVYGKKFTSDGKIYLRTRYPGESVDYLSTLSSKWITFVSSTELRLSLPNKPATIGINFEALGPAGYPIHIVVPPAADSVTPNVVPSSASRQTLTVSGRDFASKPAVRLIGGGSSQTLASQYVTFVSDRELRVSIPAISAQGVYALEITNPDGARTLAPAEFAVLAAGSGSSGSAEIDVSKTTVVTGSGWTFVGGVFNILNGANVTVSGSTIANRVVVASGATAKVTLFNAHIDVAAKNDTCAFDTTGANVNLTVSGYNTLKSGKNKAGLQVPVGATLTVDGDGSLTVSGGAMAAGIGAPAGVENPGNRGTGSGGAGGAIVINSGNLTATGGIAGAGIGGGCYGSSGANVTINGGNINALGGNNAAGIGAGECDADGDGTGRSTAIIINGGNINAAGHYGIGGYYYTNAQDAAAMSGRITNLTISGGNLTANGSFSDLSLFHQGKTTISGGIIELLGKWVDGNGEVNGDVIILGRFRGTDSDGAGLNVARTVTRGVEFAGAAGKIYGAAVDLKQNATFPAGKTLTIASGQTLTVKAGVTLTNNSDIVINSGGKLVIENGGVLINNGSITNSGVLQNNGILRKSSGTLGGSAVAGHPAATALRSLVVSVSGDGTVAPDGMSVCYAGETVRLMAWSAADSEFTGWTVTGLAGADTANPRLEFVMPDNAVTLTANFAPVGNVPTIGGRIIGTEIVELKTGYAALVKNYALAGSPSPTATLTGGNTANAALSGSGAARALTIPAGLAAGTYTAQITAANSVGVAALALTVKVSASGTTTPPPPAVDDTWNAAGLAAKGLKLSASVAVPKGVKLAKGTKAIYTWKRDGMTVASGTAKTFTAKDSGTYTLTLSYTTADGQQHSQTQNFGIVKMFAQPKTATLTMTQTTDTITNSALRAMSVVSGESLKLTVSVGTVGGGAVGPFRYVWSSGGKVVRTQESTAATDTFTTPAYGDKAVGYKCVVELVAKDAKNKPLGTAKSKDLKAKIILPPSAVTLKLSANPVKENGTLTLSATAKGTATLLFTWYKNGSQIATGSAKKFAKKPVTVSDAGAYYVVVTQDKTTRRAQSSTLTVSVQRADGTIVSGAQPQSAPMTASPSATAATSSADPRRRDAAATLSNSAASTESTPSTVIQNLAPLKLSAGDVLTVSGSATREYLIFSETQHSTGTYRYEWRDNLTAEFQDAEAQLTLRFITSDGGVYELTLSGSVNETGVFELRKK